MADRGTQAPVDLAVAAAWCALAVGLTLAQAPSPLLAVVGMPMVLLLPGYAILSITHPGAPPAPDAPPRGTRGLAFADRLALAVPVSVGGTAATGLVLHFLPVGLTRESVAIGLGMFTLLGCMLGLAARLGGTAPEDRPWFRLPPRRRRPWHEIATLVVLVCAVLAATVAAAVFVSDTQDRGYVSLFLEPDHRTDCYPLQYVGGHYDLNRTSGRCLHPMTNLTIVINNHEDHPISYRMRVVWSFVPGPEGSSSEDVLVEESEGTLQPVHDEAGLEHQSESPLPLQDAPPFPGLQYLKVQLFVDGEDTPSHALQLRVDSR